MTKMFQMMFKDSNGNKLSLVGMQDEKNGWWDYSVHSGWLPSGMQHYVGDHFGDLPIVGNSFAVTKLIQEQRIFEQVITLRMAMEYKN